MPKSDGKITDRQQRCIPFVLSSRTVEEGCERAGISKNTYYKWVNQNPAFKEAIERKSNAVSGEALQKLKDAMTRAVEVLVKLLDSESEAIRRGASNDILNHAFKAAELNEIEGRLQSVERLVLERKTYK